MRHVQRTGLLVACTQRLSLVFSALLALTQSAGRESSEALENTTFFDPNREYARLLDTRHISPLVLFEVALMEPEPCQLRVVVSTLHQLR